MKHPLLWLASLCYVVLTAGYLVRTPAFEGPDENDHAYYAFHLAHTQTLPIVLGSMARTGEPEWKNASLGHHPPLYYALLASTMGLLGHGDTTPAWTPADHHPTLKWQHGYDEAWPVSQEIWLLWILRSFSLVCGLGTLWLTWRLGCLVFPGRGIAQGAVLCLACVPQWNFMHGVLDNGNFATLLAHAGVLLIAKGLGDGRLTMSRGIVLGSVLGLGLITKLTTIFLLPIAALAWSWILITHKATRATTVRAGIVAIAVALAISGWFFLRNLALYGDVLAARAHEAAFASNRVPDEVLRQPFEYWWFVVTNLIRSFCGNFGWMHAALPDAVFYAVCAVMVLALLGWIVVRRSAEHGIAMSAQVVLLGLTISFVFASVLHFNAKFIQPQGRYLFPAAGPMVLMLVAGLVMLRDRFAPVLQGGIARLAGLALPPVSSGLVYVLCFWPAFDAGLTRAGPLHASLVAGIRSAGPVTLSADGPAPGSRCESAPTFRWHATTPEPDTARYSLHAWTRSGRILFGTHEWTGMALDAGTFTIPLGPWQQLPIGEEMLWRVRRIPDRSRHEAVGTMPVSEPRVIVRTR